jgi:chromosome segregation ATPase
LIPELLRSYRIAHGRAVAVEPFEKVLKEHTPVSGIGDPDALVEYLNQLSLKGDMVMDELKRVSADRDNYKTKFEEAEKQVTATRAEMASLISPTTSVAQGGAAAEKTGANDGDALAAVKSPAMSVMSLFSPKLKPEPTFETRHSEEFFSFDDEIPKLQTEVKEKTAEVEGLKARISTLEGDLAVAQEASSSLVGDLEKATRELNESKEAVATGQALQEQIKTQSEAVQSLKDKLQVAEARVSSLESDLERQKNEADEKATSLKTEHAAQKKATDDQLTVLNKAHKELKAVKQELEAQVKDLEESKATSERRLEEMSGNLESLNRQIEATPQVANETPKAEEVADSGVAAPSGGAKKKNKKKKKGPNAAAPEDASTGTPVKAADTASPPALAPVADDLRAEISKLKTEIIEKDAQIAKLQTKRKTEEDLREELENMQENFLSIGQEHVEAKDKIKALEAEKTALQERITKLEGEMASHKDESKASEKVDADLKALRAEYNDLKSKSAALQTDLGAAEQLATSRYRDLTELRGVLQKAQPELKALRAENESLKTAKSELGIRLSELRRLEAREKDLKADVASFKRQATDRDNEVRALNEKVSQETNSRLRFEDQNRVAQRDLRKSEAEKIQLAAAGEKSAAELVRVQGEAGKLRTRVRELEDQVSKLTTESKALHEEAELRGSQYNNAQGLLGSMRDQTSEMAMQLKEAKEQSESLEEELGEVQRLLAERTREGETMRRLLADVDDRADNKVREMRERMETAIEERDRAEDEGSINARRRAREVDELKTKIRDLERDVKRAADDRDELQRAEREWRQRRDELEAVSGRASQEADEIRGAMGELRAALDGSEKQVREAEKQRGQLRRVLDEANQRYEKLQKEFKAVQARQGRFGEGSSRASIDSGRGLSPGGPGPVNGGVDYVYLKTILLQFLEQKDKKRQADLVRTVLGQLLHFDK